MSSSVLRSMAREACVRTKEKPGPWYPRSRLVLHCRNESRGQARHHLGMLRPQAFQPVQSFFRCREGNGFGYFKRLLKFKDLKASLDPHKQALRIVSLAVGCLGFGVQ